MPSPSHVDPEKQAAPLDPGGAWPPELEAVAAAALPDFLLRQRWYPAKDAGRPSVGLRALVPFPVPDLPVAIAVWRVSPPGREPLLMLVPLARVPAETAEGRSIIAELPSDDRGAVQVLVDAVSLDAFVRSWIELVLSDRNSPDRGETPDAAHLRTGRTDHLALAGLVPGRDWAVRRGSAEQSNTSIRIDDGAILKFIRKLEEGVHPELEVGRFLTGEAGFAATPALLGWTELDGPAGATTLSVLQAFVPNEGDGWGWVLERLGRAAEAGGDRGLDDVTAWLRRLGARTAEMHRAFAVETTDSAFRPEPIGAGDLRGWTEAVRATARGRSTASRRPVNGSGRKRANSATP